MICKRCDREFVATRRKKIFCSKECLYGYKKRDNKKIVICRECGLEFKTTIYQIKRNKGRYFCSRKCWNKFNSTQSPNIKPDGHKRKDRRGYVFVKVKNHPNVNAHKMIAEHRLVMEKILGRLLLPDEYVHHKNGIKNDNRPKNLILFKTAKEHFNYLHGRLQYLEKCIENGELIWKENLKGEKYD